MYTHLENIQRLIEAQKKLIESRSEHYKAKATMENCSRVLQNKVRVIYRTESNLGSNADVRNAKIAEFAKVEQDAVYTAEDTLRETKLAFENAENDWDLARYIARSYEG